jgi:hypothetical protein
MSSGQKYSLYNYQNLYSDRCLTVFCKYHWAEAFTFQRPLYTTLSCSTGARTTLHVTVSQKYTSSRRISLSCHPHFSSFASPRTCYQLGTKLAEPLSRTTPPHCGSQWLMPLSGTSAECAPDLQCLLLCHVGPETQVSI